MLLDIIGKGGMAIYPLIALSFVAVAVIFERALFWIGVRFSRDRRLVNKILRFTAEGEPGTASEFGEGTKDFVAKVLLAGLKNCRNAFIPAVEKEIALCLSEMKKNMGILDTVISTAPILGILGTVLGIIASFKALGAGGLVDPKMVTAGISEALITTAYGLSLALVTIFPYNFFESLIGKAENEIEVAVSEAEIYVKPLSKIEEPSFSESVEELMR